MTSAGRFALLVPQPRRQGPPPPPPPPPPSPVAGPQLGFNNGAWWWWPNNAQYPVDNGQFFFDSVALFENWMGRGVTLLMNSLQNGDSSWASYFNNCAFVLGHPSTAASLSPRRTIVRFQLGITTQTAAQNFADINAGNRDAAYTSMFTQLKNLGFDRPWIGIGQESNGHWWDYQCSVNDVAGFKAAWTRVKNLAKAVDSTFVCAYDFSAGQSSASVTDPLQGAGAIVPDAMIMDWYYPHPYSDFDLVASLGKPWCIAEWATNNNTAAPVTTGWQKITNIGFDGTDHECFGQIWWETNNAYAGAISPAPYNDQPVTWAEYVAKFGGSSTRYNPYPPVGHTYVTLSGFAAGGTDNPIFTVNVDGVSKGTAQTDPATGVASWDVAQNVTDGQVLQFVIGTVTYYNVYAASLTRNNHDVRNKSYPNVQLNTGQSVSWTVA